MTDLDRAIAALPTSFPGPGGACAVLREGEIIARHAWGWANAERRIPFTPATLFRLCSITKQFTCGAILDAFPNLADLDADVASRFPDLEEPAPTAERLCHNQSGLRDYWAVAMLHGAPAESAFGDRQTSEVIRRTRTLQFRPGTRYSYCNQNFRILSDILEHRTGRSFAESLHTRLFEPAGMHTAFLAAETAAMPDGTEGYEGTQAAGFRPAINRILWTGDAGLGASLDDMIAWERYIDRSRDDPTSLYGRLSAPVTFADGTPAGYGFGLGRHTLAGRAIIGHGGALRGWRSHRLYVPSERVSVVVLFNHLSNAHTAALSLLAAQLGATPDRPASDAPPPAWLGDYLEPETGLSTRIGAGPPGKVALRYDRFPELLDIKPDGSAANDGVRLRQADDGLWMDRTADHQSTRLTPIPDPGPGPGTLDVAGRYHCAELDAELTVVNAGGTRYGAFSGFLGDGRMEQLDPAGADTWTLPCPRALDHTPPGDWTLAFRPGAVTIGCWLARNLVYGKIG